MAPNRKKAKTPDASPHPEPHGTASSSLARADDADAVDAPNPRKIFCLTSPVKKVTKARPQEACRTPGPGKATTTTTIQTQWEDLPDTVFRTLVTSKLSADIPALVAVAGTCKTWRAMVKDNVDKLNVALPPPPQLRNFTSGVAGSSSGTAKKVPRKGKNKDVWNYAAWIAKRLHLFPNLEDFVVADEPSAMSYNLGWFNDGIEISQQILEADPTYMTMHTTKFVTDELVKSLAKNCRKLRSLEAEPLKERPNNWSMQIRADIDAFNLFVSPSHVQRLFDKCPRLVETYFSTCRGMKNIAVINDIKTWLNRIKKNGVGTTVKKLRLMSEVSKDEMKMIVNTLPNLEAVDFCYRSPPGAPRHLARLNHLRWLSLCGSVIEDGDLEKMLAGIGTNLCGLSLDECEMTRDDFRAIGAHCKSLRYLSLLSCMESESPSRRIAWSPNRDITQGDISSVISDCGDTLRYLNLGCNDFVDDTMLECIANHCPEMLLLDFSNSKLVTDIGLARIASRCKKIQWLGMMYCDRMGIYTCETKEDFISTFVTPLLSLRDLRTIVFASDASEILTLNMVDNLEDCEEVGYRYGYVDGVLQTALPNFMHCLRIE
ncbi:F-box domain-containing protein [Pseudoscourfieldia marina]